MSTTSDLALQHNCTKTVQSPCFYFYFVSIEILLLQHISYFKISLTTGFVKINEFFFLFINSKLYAVIVDENVVIVCFINSTRKKKWAWFDISSNERILTKVWFILIICTLWSFKFCDFNPSIVFWILINITYCLWNHFTSLSFL